MSRYYDGYGLDSTVTLLRIAYGLDNWREVVKLGETLYEESLRIYNLQMLTKEQDIVEIHTQRAIVYYIGYSRLMQGIAYQKLLEFDKARECVLQYSDFQWIKLTNQETLNEIEFYSDIAKINLIVLDLLEGNATKLDEYVAYIQKSKGEIMSGILTLLEANRLNNLPIQEFEYLFEKHRLISDTTIMTDIDVSYYLKFSFELAMYYSRNGNDSDAIDILLNCLAISPKINQNKIKYVAFFEKIREQATHAQINTYKSILEGML